MGAVLDRQEQYSRRSCLLIHGVHEVEDEDTDELSIKVIEQYINKKTKPEDTDLTHGLGNLKKIIKAKPRTIIVKYVKYNTRKIIYGNKKF